MIFDSNWFQIIDKKTHYVLNFDFSDYKEVEKSVAIDLAVKAIVEESKDKEIYLCLSGGVDSEFAANCLHKRKVKFTPILVDYQSNQIELWYARTWCKEKNITPLVYHLCREDMIKEMNSCVSEGMLPGYFMLHFLNKKFEHKDIYLLNACGVTSPSDSIDVDKNKFHFRLSNYVQDSKNLFLYKSKELFANYLKEVSVLLKTNSAQISKSKYYGVVQRPKIDLINNILTHGKIVYDLFIDLHHKTQACHRKENYFNCELFLSKCSQKEKFHIKIEKSGEYYART